MKMKLLHTLTALCLGLSLMGCTSSSASGTPVSTQANEISSDTSSLPGTAEEEASSASDSLPEGFTHTVIDHAGNEVAIPAKMDRIVITSTPLPSAYVMFAGSAEKLIGMIPSSYAAASNSLLAELMPEITEASTDFMNGSDINIEQLMLMKPDIVFCTETQFELLTTAGIPAVVFSSSNWEYNAIDTFGAWVTLFGQIFQDEERATDIVEYGNEVYEMIQTRLAEAGDSLEKPQTFFYFNYSDGTIFTSAHFAEWWANSVGAVNSATGIEGSSVEVNMEQIYAWNPDFIFLTNFIPFLEEDIYQNTIEDQDWSTVKAVQEGKVYKIPLGVYRWFPPSADTPLMLMWLAKTVHPELFSDIDMNEETLKYYKNFYNIDLTEEQLNRIYNPSRDASGKKQ